MPVNAVSQRAVITEQNNSRGTKMRSELDGALTRIERVVVRRTEMINPVAQAGPAAG